MPDATALCTECGVEFPNEDTLREHMDMHRNRCPTCGAEFTTEAILADHERTHGASRAEDAAILERQGERKP
jgi:NAD-dependent SIR2 family protein deacetylase